MTTATVERVEQGTRSQDGRLRVVPIRQAWNVPWIVVGVLLVAGSALAFAVMGRSDVHGTPALALASEVPAGQAITESDLQIIRVDGRGLSTVSPSRRAALVGRIALVDLAPGTILAETLMAAGEVLEPGRALVGVSMNPSTVPVAGLRPGDVVMAVRTPGPTDPGDGGPPAVWRARVFAVAPVVTPSGEVIAISLDVDALDAPSVVAAAASDRVRLVLVRSLDDIPPELLFSDVVGSAPADETSAS